MPIFRKALLLLAIAWPCFADNPPLIVQESDGSPSGVATKIKFSNGTVSKSGTVFSVANSTSGVAVLASTQTFSGQNTFLNLITVSTTATFTKLSPGVMHTVATSSNVSTGLVSLSTEVTGTLPLTNMSSGATYYIQNGTSLQSPAATFNVSSGTATALFTSTININGINTSAFPVTPLFIGGNVNDYLQQVIQNTSGGTNASGNLLIASDLGGNLTNYVNLGIVSSKYNAFGASVVMSTGAYLYSSDHSLDIAADINGTDPTSNLEFVTGGVANSNIRMTIAQSGAINFLSSGTFNSHVSIPELTTGQCVKVGAGGLLTVTPCGVSQSTGSIGIALDNSGSAIVAGSTRSIVVPFGCTISSWTVLADQSGSISVHVSTCTFANYPTLSNISGVGNSPSLSTQQKNSAAPSSWGQTTLTQGDVVSFVVDSASTVTWANIVLWLLKT